MVATSSTLTSGDKQLKTFTLISTMALGLLLSATSGSAHHSFAAEFDATQPVTLKGKLTRIDWVNPHSWIYIDVQEPGGAVVNWAVETSNPNSLMRRGLRKTDFPLGVEILVKGFKAKNGKPVANGVNVTFADGRNFFTGSSGSGAPETVPEPHP
jgi:hypothetical protein